MPRPSRGSDLRPNASQDRGKPHPRFFWVPYPHTPPGARRRSILYGTPMQSFPKKINLWEARLREFEKNVEQIESRLTL